MQNSSAKSILKMNVLKIQINGMIKRSKILIETEQGLLTSSNTLRILIMIIIQSTGA